MPDRLSVALLTREYPPEIYGGAGVHVEFLARELRRLVEVQVECVGAPREEPGVHAHRPWDALREPEPEATALRWLSVQLAMVGPTKAVQVVHSHTWYANLAGHLAHLTWGIPHVATTHSLEPQRPWKAEQLGGGYHLSSWCERTGLEGAARVIAVSRGMRRDILACYPSLDPDRVKVIHNGIDPRAYHADADPATLRRYGVDPDRPYVIFVGRVTRQKGLSHLLAASLQLPAAAQIVVCAGAPDTPEIAAEVGALREQVQRERSGLVWIDGILPRADVVHLLSGAAVFCCPSIYEPFGIVNLEAMACGTAVVASDVGGIPEIVVPGETGYLVHWSESDPAAFARDLAARLGEVLESPDRARRMGESGRQRVLDHFSWERIARQTVDLYREVASS
ncbi:MAG: glycogen synthase [Candidatus Dormibacteraeota bacterium]|nr:glycogen synthase [Candidatus Dormibacteraeota bacterium]